MKTVFLDRDGVINPLIERKDEKISPQNIEAFQLFSNTEKAIRKAKQNNFQVIVVTNQPDIGKAWRSLNKNELEKMNKILEQLGVEKVYACKHGPKGSREDYYYRENGEIVTCNCRKPQIGLIERAAKEFEINFEKSYIIGDKETDIRAATNFESKTGKEFAGKLGIGDVDNSDRSFENLYSSINWIVEEKTCEKTVY